MDFDAKHYAARGINPLMAGEIIARATSELKTWKRLLSSPDDRIVLQALMFLTTMRDGKPSQSINISQQTISVQLKDIESARAIIREIRSGLSNPPQAMLAESNTSQDDIQEGELVSEDDISQSDIGESMLSGDDGGNPGGVG